MNHYVYKITCTHPDHLGEYYIGKRTCHCAIDDDSYMGSGIRITRLIEKYGIDFFHKEILNIAASETEAYSIERSIVTETILNDPKCLNLITGGHGGKQSEETRQQVSATMKQFWKNNPRRHEYSIMMKNRPDYIRQKISRATAGVPKSTEHREALSNALKGKPKSEEHRRKLSEVNKGKTMSAEALQKLHNTNQDEQVKAQRSNSAKNRPKIQCPHCERMVDTSTSKRWHFDNCKNKGA